MAINSGNEWLHQQLSAQREGQTSALLRIYHYYRIILGVLLLTVFLNSFDSGLLGTLDPNRFVFLCSTYLALNLIFSAVTALTGDFTVGSASAAFTLIVVDVLFLVGLVHYSGGVDSGLPAVTLVAVATGAIVFVGRTAYVIPAVASISLLYQEVYLHLAADRGDFFQAGLLGGLYFATTAFVSNLSNRLRNSEQRSLQRALEVADLEKLSEIAIQRMRTGILVANPQGRIRLINQSAKAMLALVDSTSTGDPLPDSVREPLGLWQADQNLRNQVVPAQGALPEIRLSFSVIRPSENSDVIVFLEDQSDLQQQAQQLKLAALGRLSASIAHEIRNPLGAISHAAQLMGESDALDPADRRLSEIIHNHCRRMNEIIANVLELSRRRNPNPELLALETWLVGFVDEYRQSRNDDTTIELISLQGKDNVRFDPSHLKQVLSNLIDNGLRYSRRLDDAPHVILAAATDPISERPVLNVIDDGPGVPADRVANLFEPFFTTEAKGTGLGLYICRELCEANHARLSYLPAEGGGSCFRITFAHPKRIT